MDEVPGWFWQDSCRLVTAGPAIVCSCNRWPAPLTSLEHPPPVEPFLSFCRRCVQEEQLNTLAARLPRLRTLFVVGCPVLYQELQALQKRFPELSIHRKPVVEPAPSSCSSSDHGL